MKWLPKFFDSKRKKGKEKEGGRSEAISSSPSMDLTPEREEEILDQIAKQVLKYGMETPAIMFLESVKPVSFIGSQLGLLFIAPYLEVFGIAGYDYAYLFEKRENVERLLKKIEEGAKTSK